MFNFLLVLMGIIGGLVVSFPFWLRWLGENDIFVTYVPEGRAMAVVRGKKFVRTIMSWTGKTIDNSGDIIDSQQLQKNWLLDFFGLQWVGLWPWFSIYSYKFPFTTVDENGEIKTRSNEVTKYVYLTDYVYFVRVKEAETSENFPVQMGLLLTVRVENPYKALFRVANWLGTLSDLVAADTRDFIGSKTFEELITRGETETQRELFARLNKTIRSVKRQYGVKVERVDIHSVDPAGEHAEKLREVATKKYVAEREAEALEALGDGRRRAIEKEASALGSDEAKMALQARVAEEMARGGRTVVMSGKQNPTTIVNLGKDQD